MESECVLLNQVEFQFEREIEKERRVIHRYPFVEAQTLNGGQEKKES